MCIDAETSLASFIIGETTGLLLLLTGIKEKQIIGLFVMFYSLVQFFEYNIYNNKNVALNSNLLLLNLASQGIILFILIKNVCNISNNYIYIGLFVLLSIYFINLYTTHENASVNTCIRWNFLKPIYNNLLFVMYITIFYLFFFDNCIINNVILNKLGYFYLGTYIISKISKILNKQINKQSRKVPSYWCLSSAVLAPILLFI